MAQAIIPVFSKTSTFRSAEQTIDPGAVVRHLCHELRQPLSTIESAAYYLQLVDRGPDPAGQERVDRHLEQIQQMVHQANRMLSDAVHLLQSSPPRPQWIDLTELIQSALHALSTDQAAELDWSETSSAPLVWMDPGQAGHLVRSLFGVLTGLAQADDAMLLSLYSEGDFAVLECSTKAPEAICRNCDRVFEPFGSPVPGAGLALASVQRIVDAHKGSAIARSERDILTIELRLPAAIH
ncbi:MAG: HAMP domain-containing histidine kinase [Acidobacteria bacterium]|nr:HAMP domain-containing histidine kinase [Acidobacteriota bacterium]